MDAMDAELRKIKGVNAHAADAHPTETGTGLNVVDEDDSDEEAAMEAELAALLQRDPQDLEDGGQRGLIKNLLASFNSQEGLPGPVSNLAGRLDPNLKLPRDAE